MTGQRRRAALVSPFYAGFLDGLPAPLHASFGNALDVLDATRWLERGVPPEGFPDPRRGGRIRTPGRLLVRAFGRDADGSRWCLFSRWRFGSDEVDLVPNGWELFDGSRTDGETVRLSLRAAGRGNASRYHVWWDHGDAGSPDAVPSLYRYSDPLPDPFRWFDPDLDADPDRTLLPLTDRQAAFLSAAVA